MSDKISKPVDWSALDPTFNLHEQAVSTGGSSGASTRDRVVTTELEEGGP